jgi:hypothetical protein
MPCRYCGSLGHQSSEHQTCAACGSHEHSTLGHEPLAPPRGLAPGPVKPEPWKLKNRYA